MSVPESPRGAQIREVHRTLEIAELALAQQAVHAAYKMNALRYLDNKKRAGVTEAQTRLTELEGALAGLLILANEADLAALQDSVDVDREVLKQIELDAAVALAAAEMHVIEAAWKRRPPDKVGQMAMEFHDFISIFDNKVLSTRSRFENARVAFIAKTKELDQARAALGVSG